MDLSSIRAALRSEPFKPFDLCLADGRRVPVKHPEFVAMNKQIVVVVDEESFSTAIERRHIVSLEPHRGSSKPRDGSQGKKRKP